MSKIIEFSINELDKKSNKINNKQKQNKQHNISKVIHNENKSQSIKLVKEENKKEQGKETEEKKEENENKKSGDDNKKKQNKKKKNKKGKK